MPPTNQGYGGVPSWARPPEEQAPVATPLGTSNSGSQAQQTQQLPTIYVDAASLMQSGQYFPAASASTVPVANGTASSNYGNANNNAWSTTPTTTASPIFPNDSRPTATASTTSSPTATAMPVPSIFTDNTNNTSVSSPHGSQSDPLASPAYAPYQPQGNYVNTPVATPVATSSSYATTTNNNNTSCGTANQNSKPNNNRCVCCTICFCLTFFVTMFIIVIAASFSSSDNDNVHSDLTDDENIFFGGMGMGFLKVKYQNKIQCVTYTDEWRGSVLAGDFILQDCASTSKLSLSSNNEMDDAEAAALAALLERQVFYYDPIYQQIVLNAFGECLWRHREEAVGLLECSPDNADERWFTDDQGRIRNQPDSNIQDIANENNQTTDNDSNSLLCLTATVWRSDPEVRMLNCYDHEIYSSQVFFVSDQFWDPPPPTLSVEPIQPNVVGALQLVVTEGEEGEGCVAYDKISNQLVLDDCTLEDHQLFQFNDETLEIMVETGDGCIERQSDDENVNGTITIQPCQTSIIVSANTNTIVPTTSNESTVISRTFTTNTTAAPSGMGSITASGGTLPPPLPPPPGFIATTGVDSSTERERQQWYFDREGRLYHYPRKKTTEYSSSVASTTSFCVGAGRSGSSSSSGGFRQRYLKRGSGSRPSGGGSRPSSGGSKPSSSGSKPSSGGSSSSSSTGSKGPRSPLISTGGTSSTAGTTPLTTGYPSSFGSTSSVGSTATTSSGSSFSGSNSGAFRPSHPTYAARRPGTFYVARNPSYYRSRHGRTTSSRGTRAPTAVWPIPLGMDACRSQFGNDPFYDNQRFTFVPANSTRQGVFRNGTGCIELGSTGLCLTVTEQDPTYFPGDLSLIVRAEKCTCGPNQEFEYDTTNGVLEATGNWSGNCMRDDSVNGHTNILSNCSANKEFLTWRQDFKGRLVYDKDKECLTWNAPDYELSRSPCVEGEAQRAFWRAEGEFAAVPTSQPTTQQSSALASSAPTERPSTRDETEIPTSAFPLSLPETPRPTAISINEASPPPSPSESSELLPVAPMPSVAPSESSATEGGTANIFERPMETVELIPFGLLYDIDRIEIPSRVDYDAAAVLTAQYLDGYFKTAYPESGESGYIYTEGELTPGATAYSLLTGALQEFEGTAMFSGAGEIPTPAVLEAAIATAFAQPDLQKALDLLATLPAENAFSTVKDIRFTAASVGP